MDEEYETISPGLNKAKIESHKKFSLMKKNDSSTKPSPYNNGGSQKSLNNQNIEFSLRNLDSF